jgi:murein DD-endopeptidase
MARSLMTSSLCATCLGFSFALAVILGTPQATVARERGPRVEVVCPSPPIPVKLDEQQILVYELHVTNFDIVPLMLKSVEVFGNTDQSQPLKTILDDALSGTMVEVGSKSGAKNSQIIEPGNRAVVFMWIELGPDRRIPTSLRHRMVFATTVKDGSVKNAPENTVVEATLDEFLVPISHDDLPEISSPFDGGVWVAGEGPANDSGHRRSLLAIDGSVHSPERFAIDWVKVGPNGDSHHDGTNRNENWWGYGEAVHSVADGEVTQTMDGIPENTPRVLPQPVTLDNIAGNYVVVRISPNRYVTYAHLQNGSIRVRVHDHIHRGDVLARLGNTGQATGPHLHFQITDRDSVLESEGVPFVFESFTDLGPGSDYELDKHPSTPRTHSIPRNNAVVEFTPIRK